MKRRISHTRPMVAGLLVLGLAVSSAWSISWWGKRDNREGLVAMVRNKAILLPTEGAAKVLELNDAFQVDDRIKTKADSAVRVLFMEDSFLNIGANTDYSLSKSRYDEITGARDVGFSLFSGKVRLAVGRLFGRGSASVDTPTAVVGVKGTDVIIDHDLRRKRTLVLVLLGEVEVTSKNPQLSGVVTTVTGGNYTEVDESSTTPAVHEAPQSLIDSLLQDTSVLADPERTTPDATIAEASQVPVAPSGATAGTDTTVVSFTLVDGSTTGGNNNPVAGQDAITAGTGFGDPSPMLLPPPITTVPPDQCPGCPP